MAELWPSPVKFSDCHSCNIVLYNNRLISEGKYIRAHGQFITRTPLVTQQQFRLTFSGSGIVKFNTFPNRSQAVDWVRSKQPLPRGCRRVRFSGRIEYYVSIPRPGRCVLFESKHDEVTKQFTLDAGPQTNLAFDIEYGNVVVTIDNSTCNLTFDTFCCSPHIEISTSQRSCSAKLLHYNPTSLCCLEDATLQPGAIFSLDVTSSGVSRDTGSYIRVCVAKQFTQYENNGQTGCFGTVNHPSYKGQRILIHHDSQEMLVIHVVPEGLCINRGWSRALDNINFSLRSDQTLWFELHKVSLRVCQLVDQEYLSSYPSRNRYYLDNEDCPPSEPAPPPPGTTSSQLTHRQPQRHRAKDFTKRYFNQPEQQGICNAGYISDGSRSNRPHSEQDIGNYVSVENLGPTTYVTNRKCPHNTSERTLMSLSGALKYDLLSDAFVDYSPCVSSGGDLVTLSSNESLNHVHVQGDCLSQNPRCLQHNSHYEIPQAIWESCKSKHSAIKPKNWKERPNEAENADKSANERYKILVNSQQKVFYCSHRNSVTNGNQIGDVLRGSPKDVDCVTTLERSGRHKMCTSLTQFEKEVNRREVCKKWVEEVNLSRKVWQCNENEVIRATQECHCRHGWGNANECIRLRGSGRDAQDKYKFVCQRSNASVLPTSSVWLSDECGYNGESDEFVNHDLDLCIVPVQGKLRCHSCYSDIKSCLTDDFPVLDKDTNRRISQVSHDGSVKTLVSLSSRCGTLRESVTEKNSQETSLKETFGLSESLSESSKSETQPKSINSGGFSVDLVEDFETCSDRTKDVAHLKYLAQKESGSHMDTQKELQDREVNKHLPKSPKPCTQQTTSEYCLASPLNSEIRAKENIRLNIDLSDTKWNQVEEDCSDSDESTNSYKEYDDNHTPTFLGVATLANGSDKENELNDQGVDSDSGIVEMRNDWRKMRRNITESIVSNSSRAMLSIGPTIKMPEGVGSSSNEQPLKRSETLKRNLDTSPRPSVRKDCGPKICLADRL